MELSSNSSLEEQVEYWRKRCLASEAENEKLRKEASHLRRLLASSTSETESSMGRLGEDEESSTSESDSVSSASSSRRTPKGLGSRKSSDVALSSLASSDPWDNVKDQDLVIEGGDCKAGSLPRLIERLTADAGKALDVNDFLPTYRSFTTPLELFDALMKRYRTPGILFLCQIKVVNVFKVWSSTYWSDFMSEPSLRDKTMSFLNEIASTNPTQINAIKAKIESLSAIMPTPPVSLLPDGAEDSEPRNPNWLVLNHDPLEVAKQLTLKDWEHWVLIKPAEFFGLGWTKADKLTTSPNIVAMTQWFNEVSNWVVAAVVTTEDPKKRVDVIQRFLTMADHLKRLGNFNGMMAIQSGLDRGPIYRMKLTMDTILANKKSAAVFSDLKFLANQKNNCSNLRNAIKNFNPPLIPYLGLFLTDITFIEDGNPDKRGNLIHYRKCTLLAETLKKVRQYQQTSYSFNPDPVFHIAFTQFKKQLSDDLLYDLSNYLEPREGRAQEERPPILDVMRARFHRDAKKEVVKPRGGSASEVTVVKPLPAPPTAGHRARSASEAPQKDRGRRLSSGSKGLEPMAAPPPFLPPSEFGPHILHPIGRKYFGGYLSSADLKRQLDFVCEVEALKLIDDQTRVLEVCRDIYTRFLAISSPDRIALPEQLVSALKEALKKKTANTTYNDISEYIVSTNLKNIWTSYILTKQYDTAIQEMIAEHAKKSLSSSRKQKESMTSSGGSRKGVNLAQYLTRKKSETDASGGRVERPRPPSLDLGLLDKILALGIDKNAAERALKLSGNNLEKAMTVIFNPPSSEVDVDKLAQLVALGIDLKRGEEALLKSKNDYQIALESLFPEKPSDSFEESSEKDQLSSSVDSNSRPSFVIGARSSSSSSLPDLSGSSTASPNIRLSNSSSSSPNFTPKSESDNKEKQTLSKSATPPTPTSSQTKPRSWTASFVNKKPSPSPSKPVDFTLLKKMTDLGVDFKLAEEALAKSGNNLDAALEFAMNAKAERSAQGPAPQEEYVSPF